MRPLLFRRLVQCLRLIPWRAHPQVARVLLDTHKGDGDKLAIIGTAAHQQGCRLDTRMRDEFVHIVDLSAVVIRSNRAGFH